MKRLFVALLALLATATLSAQKVLPTTIDIASWEAGVSTAGHIQGIAVDTQRGYIYVSFTTLLVKLDMEGNILGSVTGLLGHLGCLDFNEEDGRIYGSLEYKNDAIGRHILKQEGVTKEVEDRFYIAIFDGEKITRKGMNAERDEVMTTVHLGTVLADYKATVPTEKGRNTPHRWGCSGIDGVSFGPSFNGKGGNMLTVAYGIYGDRDRSDNDYQVLLQYDTRKWNRYESALSQDNAHTNGPVKPNGRYFVYTGNTRYGVQNLEYDKNRNLWFLAVYKGKKPQFANYSLFVVDGTVKASKGTLLGCEYQHKGNLLHLAEMGHIDPRNPEIRGWHEKLGVFGICALGNDLFYLASGKKNPQGQTATLRLVRFIGSDKAWEEVR